MTQDELARRRQHADAEPLVVSKVPEGFRVYSPTSHTRPYLVSGTAEAPLCTCLDFQEHGDDPDWRCKHIAAALRESGAAPEPGDAYTREERAAIQAESGDGDDPTARTGITQMLIKRSVSPDGRIDSLSVEFACHADGESLETLTARAQEVLQIQGSIAGQFLKRNGRASREQLPPSRVGPATGQAVPAELVRVGGSDGKWGRRLFLTIAADGRMLRLYGTQSQLAAHVTRAGFPDLASELVEGLRLDVPCWIVTKAGPNGGFLTVEKVLAATARGGAA
jgi:hypothetical protein